MAEQTEHLPDQTFDPLKRGERDPPSTQMNQEFDSDTEREMLQMLKYLGFDFQFRSKSNNYWMNSVVVRPDYLWEPASNSIYRVTRTP